MKLVHMRKQHFDVRIDRATKWGNPFVVGVDGTRKEVIAKYRDWIKGQPHLLDALPELEGKVLGCWCHPKACHGEVLLELLKARKTSLFRQKSL